MREQVVETNLVRRTVEGHAPSWPNPITDAPNVEGPAPAGSWPNPITDAPNVEGPAPAGSWPNPITDAPNVEGQAPSWPSPVTNAPSRADATERVPPNTCLHCPLHPTVLQVGDLRLDLITRTAYRGGKVIALTARETRLLEFLMRHAGEPCRRKDIRETAWDFRGKHNTKVLEVNINRLRAKIDDGFETRMIHTIHGVGYMLKAEC